MASVTEVDVLVIGLGPAGASAAAAAARAGARTLAFDRRHEAGVPVQCAELVPGLIGQEAAAVSGALTQPVHGMRTFVESDPPEIRAPFPGYMIDRAVFDRRLVERASEAGAVCRHGVSVRTIEAGGSVLTGAGQRIAARTIIGADGPLSIVGRALGRTNRDLVYARQVRVPLANTHDATDIFLSARVPGGYGWLFPKGEQANVGVGVMASQRSRLKALLGELLAQLRGEYRIEAGTAHETGGVIPAGGMLYPCGTLGTKPVLLAGDAAGLTNPVTGAGIHAALVSGRLAGETAVAWLAGDARAPSDYAADLDELFGSSFARALARRRALLDHYRAGDAPDGEALRRGWIAYPAYWRSPVPEPPTPGAKRKPSEVAA